MRRQTWLAIAAALALTACDGETTEADAGSDAATPTTDAGGMDAGRDAGPDDEDGGTDAGTVVADGGADGSTADPDGGPLVVGDCTGAPITVAEDCPAFTACGGTLSDSVYCYTGVCIDEDTILGPLSTVCAGSTLEDPSGMIAGQVSFLPGNQVQRETVSHAEVTLVIPATCPALTFLGCDGLEGQIEDRVPDSTASCSMATGAPCRCVVTIDSAVDMTESFTANETTGVLTVGTGSSMRTYRYCADETDGSLRFEETTPGGGAEPGIQSLAPAPAP